MHKKRILVAVLNWGLGHATRCIPIIEELQQHNFEDWGFTYVKME